MTLQTLPGFESLETFHCVTGSLRHIYVYNEHPLSEDLLLGLGGGVGFIYWHTKGTLPFVGGRANARGEFEPLVGERTGVDIQAFTTSSARKAEKTLLNRHAGCCHRRFVTLACLASAKRLNARASGLKS